MGFPENVNPNVLALSLFGNSALRSHFQVAVPIRIRKAPRRDVLWRNAGEMGVRTPRDQVSEELKNPKIKSK